MELHLTSDEKDLVISEAKEIIRCGRCYCKHYTA